MLGEGGVDVGGTVGVPVGISVPNFRSGLKGFPSRINISVLHYLAGAGRGEGVLGEGGVDNR